MITVSPSSRELEKMGKTEKEQAEAMRKYVRDDVMQHYAEGFGKGLNKEDIEYYGKIHLRGREPTGTTCTHISSSAGRTGATPGS